MAGYLVIKTSDSLTLTDLRSLVSKANSLGLSGSSRIHIGVLDGETVLAIPAPVTKQMLPPTTRNNKRTPMRPARRARA